MPLHPKLHETPFIVNDNTKINFGKFKTKPHLVLLEESNKPYVEWLLATESDFATSTKVWLQSKGIGM